MSTMSLQDRASIAPRQQRGGLSQSVRGSAHPGRARGAIYSPGKILEDLPRADSMEYARSAGSRHRARDADGHVVCLARDILVALRNHILIMACVQQACWAPSPRSHPPTHPDQERTTGSMWTPVGFASHRERTSCVSTAYVQVGACLGRTEPASVILGSCGAYSLPFHAPIPAPTGRSWLTYDGCCVGCCVGVTGEL